MQRPLDNYHRPVRATLAVYWALLAGFVLLALLTRTPPPSSTGWVDPAVAVERAGRIYLEFMAIPGWEPKQLVRARNEIMDLKFAVADKATAAEIQTYLDLVVQRGKREYEAAVATQGAAGSQNVIMRNIRLQNEYVVNQPRVVSDRQLNIEFGDFAWPLAFAWALFLPFGVVLILINLRREGLKVDDVIKGDLNEFGFAVMTLPFSLMFYPNPQRMGEVRKRVAEMEERWGVSSLPVWLMPMMRTAMYVAVVVGMVTSAISRAQAATPGAEVHGFVQMLGESSADKPAVFTRERAFVDFRANPTPEVGVFVRYDAASNTPKDMQVSYRPGEGPVTVRAGQIFGRFGLMTPVPFKQPLIGGPLAFFYPTGYDVGAEVAVDIGGFTLAGSVLSGAGPNKPDDNSSKDFQLFGARKFGNVLVELAGQGGEQPNGWRTRGAVHLAWLGDTFADLFAATERVGSANWSRGISALFGRRLLAWLQLAGGVDRLELAGAPRESIVRAQATFFTAGDAFSVGVLGKWSSLAGLGGLLRMQAVF